MKTKELIRQLNKADPSGELECCVGNIDIFFVDTLPCYYDGSQQVFIRDDKGRIESAEIRRYGTKVNLYTLSIEDHLVDHLDFPVRVCDNNSWDIARVAKWRQEAIEIEEEIQKEQDDGRKALSSNIS